MVGARIPERFRSYDHTDARGRRAPGHPLVAVRAGRGGEALGAARVVYWDVEEERLRKAQERVRRSSRAIRSGSGRFPSPRWRRPTRPRSRLRRARRPLTGSAPAPGWCSSRRRLSRCSRCTPRSPLSGPATPRASQHPAGTRTVARDATTRARYDRVLGWTRRQWRLPTTGQAGSQPRRLAAATCARPRFVQQRIRPGTHCFFCGQSRGRPRVLRDRVE